MGLSSNEMGGGTGKEVLVYEMSLRLFSVPSNFISANDLAKVDKSRKILSGDMCTLTKLV